MTDTDRVIDWIIKTDNAKKYDVSVKEVKLFGLTIYKKITIFQNMMRENILENVIKNTANQSSDNLRKYTDSDKTKNSHS